MPLGTDYCRECGTHCPDAKCPGCEPEPIVIEVGGIETELVSPDLIRRYREQVA